MHCSLGGDCERTWRDPLRQPHLRRGARRGRMRPCQRGQGDRAGSCCLARHGQRRLRPHRLRDPCFQHGPRHRRSHVHLFQFESELIAFAATPIRPTSPLSATGATLPLFVALSHCLPNAPRSESRAGSPHPHCLPHTHAVFPRFGGITVNPPTDNFLAGFFSLSKLKGAKTVAILYEDFAFSATTFVVSPTPIVAC